MKKIFSFGLALGLLLTALSITSTPTANAQSAGLVSSLVSRMEKNRLSLKTLRANISMWKYNAQLREEDTYQGVVLYIPGPGGSRASFMRLDWTSPQHETLAISKGSYMFYRPRLKTVIYGTTSSVGGSKNNDVLQLMGMSAAQLRTKFGEFQDVRDETLGGVWTQHFRVTPKGAASYKYIEIWVDKEGFPVQSKMVEKNDDATTMRLTNVQKNQSISPSEFILNLDASVKRVKG
ncbi:MAG: Outer rane lipoprotein carrier protein LolA [Blastocatellia bacterium]|nr:Outer rane lipoprotein carrier protein LolA [Blastocatellia bacterium]